MVESNITTKESLEIITGNLMACEDEYIQDMWNKLFGDEQMPEMSDMDDKMEIVSKIHQAALEYISHKIDNET